MSDAAFVCCCQHGSSSEAAALPQRLFFFQSWILSFKSLTLGDMGPVSVSEQSPLVLVDDGNPPHPLVKSVLSDEPSRCSACELRGCFVVFFFGVVPPLTLSSTPSLILSSGGSWTGCSRDANLNTFQIPSIPFPHQLTFQLHSGCHIFYLLSSKPEG